MPVSEFSPVLASFQVVGLSGSDFIYGTIHRIMARLMNHPCSRNCYPEEILHVNVTVAATLALTCISRGAELIYDYRMCTKAGVLDILLVVVRISADMFNKR